MTEATQRPASNVAIIQTSGLGVETKPALDPFGVWHRRQKKNRVPGKQWFSSLAYYLGPFGDGAGLDESAEFFRKTSLYGKPPQIYLTATDGGLGIIPTSNSIMRSGRGVQPTIWVTYTDIESVELHPASKARMRLMTPGSAYKLGQVVIHTRAGRKALLSGTTVAGLSAFLVSQGAHVQT